MFLHLSVILLTGGHGWLLLGGHAWLLRGGVCMVALVGRHAWLLGGMRGCSGGACVVALGGGRAWDTTRYGDMINERAVRILLECNLVYFFDENASIP